MQKGETEATWNPCII